MATKPRSKRSSLKKNGSLRSRFYLYIFVNSGIKESVANCAKMADKT
jgi:hypothetical protein